MRPSSLQYTPTPRLTLVVRVSALNASLRPRIGSRGAISTAENRLIFAAALNGSWRGDIAPAVCTRAVRKRGVSIKSIVGGGDSRKRVFQDISGYFTTASHVAVGNLS